MIERSSFDIDIKFDGKSDLKEVDDFQFGTLSILETVNQIPYYELGISAANNDPSRFFRVKNIKINLKAKIDMKGDDKNSFTGTLGVNKIVRSGNRIIFSGWMTDWENFKIPRTRFLGTDIKAAITSCNIRDGNHIKYSDNITGRFHQINETNLQQCLALCAAASSYPYWSITKNMILLDEQPEIQNKSNTKMSEYKVSEGGGHLILNMTNREQEEVTEKSDGENFSASSYYRDVIIADGENTDPYARFLKNYKSSRIGFPYVLETPNVEGFPIFQIGDQLENNDKKHYPDVKSWVIISMYTTYVRGSVRTNIQYGGLVK